MTSFDPKRNVSEQLEQEAGLYEPAIYELLSFYGSLKNEPDEMSGQFIPITSIKPLSPKETKIFAVGVLPPSSNVTGRILDRSATVSTLVATAEGSRLERDNLGSGRSIDSTDHTTGGEGGIGSSTTVPIGPLSTNSEKFWDNFVVMCNRLGCQAENLAMVIKSESEWQAHQKNPTSGAAGLIQLIRATAHNLGLTDEEFNNFHKLSALEQLPTIERFYRSGSKVGASRVRGKSAAEIKMVTFGAFNNPNGSIYDSQAAEKGFNKPDKQQRAYNQNRSHDRGNKGYITADDLFVAFSKRAPLTKTQQASINAARARVGMRSSPVPVLSDVPARAATDWQQSGSGEADESKRLLAKTAGTNVNARDLAQNFKAAQLAMIKDMQNALKQMAKTPPLRLLVNPTSFQVSSEKVISDGNWGRNGPIIEHWGENQDRIEGSGKIAAFYSLDAAGVAGDPTAGSVGNSPGLGRTARQFSQSYQNLLSLWLIYKNNAGVWFPDYVDSNSSKGMNLSVVGSVYIYYDSILYIGSFESFNLTESETTPFTLEYTFSFNTRAWFLLDRVEDQAFTYGAPQIFNSGTPPGLPTGRPSPVSIASNAQPAPEVALPPEPLEGFSEGTVEALALVDDIFTPGG